MKLNNKGQVTVPVELRVRHNLQEGDEVDVIEEAGVLRIVRAGDTETRGHRLVRHMRGRGTAREVQNMTTDELLDLLRGG